MSYCPECERLNRSDYERYGFVLSDNCYYWTIIKEVKTCCPVKVKLEKHTATDVIVSYGDKQYTKKRGDFMKSSWRDIDSY